MNEKAQMIMKNSFSCDDAPLDRSDLRVLPARDLLASKLLLLGDPGSPFGDEDDIISARFDKYNMTKSVGDPMINTVTNDGKGYNQR